MLHYQILVYTIQKNKISYKNNKFKLSGSTWDKEFELSDWLYTISYIHNYFDYIIKKLETVTNNPP